MQLLLVHRDAEISAQLTQMLKAYTSHDCELVRSDTEALAWAETHSRCDFLLAQFEANGINGFTLGGGLSERFAGLQTAFFPAYRASEQRLEIRDTKIFPEPIDGERLLEMLQASRASAMGRDLFHPADILQMCCLTKKGGALQMVSNGRTGVIFLRDGRITYAEAEGPRGTAALSEIIGWEFVEFAYDASVLPDAETISGPWDKVLIEAVKGRKRVSTPLPPLGRPARQR